MTDIKCDTRWQFRAVSLMNLTKDAIGNTPRDEIGGNFTANLKKAIGYAVEVGANYVECAFSFGAKPTREELLPYYEVVPRLAREAGLNVYFRFDIPTTARNGPDCDFRGRILNKQGDMELFGRGVADYFEYLKKFMTGMGQNFLRPGDIFSTWAEGDSSFDRELGWEAGTARYRQYTEKMGALIRNWLNTEHPGVLYAESVCGGEGRLREQFTPDSARHLDIIMWDHYAGVNTGGKTIPEETVERMTASAADTARCIEQYAKALGVRVALGEWSTHWSIPKSKEVQKQYIEIMTSALDRLPSRYFPGMMYFHFAHPGQSIDYDKAKTYFAAFVADKNGPYPGLYALKEAYGRHTG